jgi:PAS domain S-box-containing protein
VTVQLIRPFREWTLGAKLAITFLVVIAGVATFVGVAVTRHERAALDAELRKRGVNLAENLARLSRDLVLQDDLWGLYKVVRDIASGAGDSENVVVYAMVLDPAGQVLAHSDPARHPMGELIRESGAGHPQTATVGTRVHTVTTEGETVHDVATPIVVDNQRIGVVRVGITTRHLEATVAWLTRDILLLTSVLGALGVALGFLVSRRMTRPLRELGRAVDRLGEGHLEEPVSVTTTEKDEIGRLADRFNRMAQRLRDTVGEIAATKQYLENLLEHANDFIYTLDLDGRITYLNHQFFELGLRKEDLIGEPLEALVRRPTPSTADRVLPPLPRQMFEVQVTGRDGRPRTLVVTESPLLDNDWRRIGTLGIAKDVTELTELQSRLIRSERLASVGELAGALAHEIRNPLGSLFAAAKMLSAESPQAAGYDRPALLQVIADEARRLERTLSDFLAFARPRPPVRRSHSLNGLIGEVLDAVRLDEMANDKTMATRLDPDLPPVPVDADQIKQALWNVVRNALEATPPGGRLDVSTHAVDGRVVIEVADSGPGIPAERQARLFEPFQTTKPSGSGLGLAIAHRIVTAHDGSIEVTSQPGVGTRVRVDLPREPSS